MATENKRILSLDILRGVDLFMLVGLQPILWQIFSKSNSTFLNTTLLSQIDHVAWEGFSCWDLVMPLFLFMSGVTMPYSLPKYINAKPSLWKRVIFQIHCRVTAARLRTILGRVDSRPSAPHVLGQQDFYFERSRNGHRRREDVAG